MESATVGFCYNLCGSSFCAYMKRDEENKCGMAQYRNYPLIAKTLSPQDIVKISKKNVIETV